ncbi:hypothetical protein G7043_22100 [Lentzea sp. NEAU-D13]|uniref:Uncharacterized protein n=1 Tax=Lentzea alba TaxID=2714351 RepID=A0A7C9RRF6_9PSEU|nr:hypothetical protein [Lentzea alba]NGY61625.1 hypothetical protein [Lentzea alba]
MEIGGRTVHRVGVIDDDEHARQSYSWAVQDAQLEAVAQNDPIVDLARYTDDLLGRVDAVLCDQHLRVSQFAPVDGAQIAATLYSRGFPAVLCTRWENSAHLDEIRPFLDRIPVLLSWEDLEPERLLMSLEITIAELTGTFAPHRRPYRTQICVVEVEENHVTVEIPGWHSEKFIQLPRKMLPDTIRSTVRAQYRCHAQVNLEAEDPSTLYFKDWEAA